MLVDAKAAIETGRDMHGNSIWQAIYPSWGDYKLPLYPLLVIFSAKIIGVNEVAVRLPSLIAGLLHLYLIFNLAKVLFPKKRSIWWLSAIVLGLSPWSILFARTGFEANLGQFLLTASTYFALVTSKNPRKKLFFYLISVLLGAAAVYSYYSVRFVWPIVFTAVIFLSQLSKTFSISNIKHISQIIVPSLALFGLLMLPILYSPHYQASQQFRLSTPSVLNIQEFNEKSIQLKNLDNQALLGRIYYHPRFLQLKQFVSNYGKNLDPNFLFIHSDQNLRHTTARHGLFLLAFAPFLIIGVIGGVSKYSKSSILLIIWWMTALIPASVSYELPHALRSLNALTPITILLAVGMFEAYRWMVKQKKQIATSIIMFWTVLLMINLLDFSSDYFFSYPQRSASAWSDGHKQLVVETWTLLNENPDIENVFVDRSDGRIHLWFMAFGPTPGRNFETLETDQYLFRSIDKIEFTPAPDLDKLSGRAILVYPENMISEFTNKYNLKIIDSRYASAVDGTIIAKVTVVESSDE